MQNRVFACTCGNIRVNGQTVPHGLIPNIPGGEKARCSQCAALIVVQSRSITVGSLHTLSTKQLSNVCVDFFCSSCHAGFRLFYGRRHSFIGRLPPVPATSDMIERHDIPQILRPFISPESFNRESLSETLEPAADDGQLRSRRSPMDADFEMMFGNRGDVVVGSYKHYRGGQNERFVFADSVPHSYFA